MTETPTESVPFAWLPADQLAAWLQLDQVPADAPQRRTAEDCRRAAAAWIEDQRRDVDYAGEVSPALVQAGVLAAARLYARRSSPAGLASFGEFGAAEVLRGDPDVTRLAGLGRHAEPRVG